MKGDSNASANRDWTSGERGGACRQHHGSVRHPDLQLLQQRAMDQGIHWSHRGQFRLRGAIRCAVDIQQSKRRQSAMVVDHNSGRSIMLWLMQALQAIGFIFIVLATVDLWYFCLVWVNDNMGPPLIQLCLLATGVIMYFLFKRVVFRMEGNKADGDAGEKAKAEAAGEES